ncbi:hypothetical protein TUM22923_03790 [Polynucleobacter sp. TUM22923]|uniref:hypothetical protein n=1 Tax=Polynucleobacter sp. TUM22923 TaxID=3022126 RepID=UPI0025732F7F|nr:hypothetical protein [Polynucleobacter sp. TUM22923]BDX21058.1 hypothetical protein TUM22923_03790 [Polynucleobacter sp. TUM22923]
MKRLLLLSALISLLLIGCAYQPVNTAYDPPGFFMGLIHGWISPIALVVGIFSDVRVYAFPNSGWWYDLGFMLGISTWGGAAASR